MERAATAPTRSVSYSMFDDLERLKHDFDAEDAMASARSDVFWRSGRDPTVLKNSLSMMDLPRTPFQERRGTLYASLPMVAVPGLATRTNDVVREISYGRYVAERGLYRTLDESGRTFSDHARRSPADPLQRRYNEMRMKQRRGELEGLTRSYSFLHLSREPSALNLALVPRTTEEAALYAACRTAEDELFNEVVSAPLLMAAAVACVSQFLCGYNTGVMNAFEASVFPGHSQAAWALAVAAFAIGGPFGALAGGRVANARGRRSALLLDALLFLAGGSLFALAPSMAALVLARFVVGVASGLASVLVPVYLGELAPPVLRGTFGTCTQFAMVIGILAADCGAFVDVSWRFAFGATPALALLQLLCAPYLLESPKWLLDRDAGSAAARSALRRLYGFRDAEALEQEVIHIIGDGGGAAKRDVSVGALLADPSQRPLLLSCVALHVAQQLCGINAVFYYSTMFFEGVLADPALGSALVAGVNVVATYVAIVLMDRRGRRELLMWSAGGMGASTLVLTAALLGLVPTAASLAAVCAFVSFFEIGLGPIPWLIVAEMFDGPALDAAQSAACQVNWACNFLVGLGFPAINAALGPACFLPFGAVLAAAFAFVRAALPETRGLTVKDIQAKLASKAVVVGLPRPGYAPVDGRGVV